MANAISKSVFGAAIIISAVGVSPQIASAQGFTDNFAPEQWELFNSSPAFPDIDNSALAINGVPLAPFNGSVEFDAPESLTLLGSNQSGILEQFGFTCNTVPSDFSFLCRDSFTTVYVTVPESGELFFDWEYITDDIGGAAFDLFGFVVSDLPPEALPDSPFSQLSDRAGATAQTGSTTVAIEANEIFGFSIGTGDNQGGRAQVTITNFGLRISEPDEGPVTSVPEPSFAIAALAGLGLFWKRNHKPVK
ncbi:MAG: hypothetical protein AAF821_07290 [Cyanobacteria bacterium P01_D01_bin.156]